MSDKVDSIVAHYSSVLYCRTHGSRKSLETVSLVSVEIVGKIREPMYWYLVLEIVLKYRFSKYLKSTWYLSTSKKCT